MVTKIPTFNIGRWQQGMRNSHSAATKTTALQQRLKATEYATELE
jgi:hypothetical protein